MDRDQGKELVDYLPSVALVLGSILLAIGTFLPFHVDSFGKSYEANWLQYFNLACSIYAIFVGLALLLGRGKKFLIVFGIVLSSLVFCREILVFINWRIKYSEFSNCIGPYLEISGALIMLLNFIAAYYYHNKKQGI